MKLKLKRKPLVMMDIIDILIARPGRTSTRKDIYNNLMQSGKYRTYLSNNRYHSILSLMSRRGFITIKGDAVNLNINILSMPRNELMATISMPTPWPQDIVDGLI